LNKHDALKRKDEVHITLKFFKKDDKDMKKGIVNAFKKFIEEHWDEVSLMITGIGYHQGTCALQVSSTITTKDETVVPWTHDKQNHITIALEEGKNAKDSIFAVMKQNESGDYPGDFISFEPPIVITGHLQTFSS
jgi:2'-5' RNA ligase